jgi:hypothetical protein
MLWSLSFLFLAADQSDLAFFLFFSSFCFMVLSYVLCVLLSSTKKPKNNIKTKYYPRDIFFGKQKGPQHEGLKEDKA